LAQGLEGKKTQARSLNRENEGCSRLPGRETLGKNTRVLANAGGGRGGGVTKLPISRKGGCRLGRGAGKGKVHTRPHYWGESSTLCLFLQSRRVSAWILVLLRIAWFGNRELVLKGLSMVLAGPSRRLCQKLRVSTPPVLTIPDGRGPGSGALGVERALEQLRFAPLKFVRESLIGETTQRST